MTGSLTKELIKNIDKIDPDIVIIDDHMKAAVKGSEVIKATKI